MPDQKPPIPGLKSLVEQVFGLELDEEQKRRLETKLGTTFDDDPSRWTDVKRTLAVQAGEDPDAEGIVDAVIDRLEDELDGERAVPATWTADERAIFATRAVESAIEDDGPEGLRSVPRAWIDEAVAGYGRLGLAEHAAVTTKIAGALEGSLSEPDIDDLMEDWLNVVNADDARAAWIRDHPDGFRA